MTLQLPATETSSGVRWMNPEAGLWVAHRHGDYAGMVERSAGEYHARSARGRALGSFPDLDSALAVIDGGVEASEGAPRGARALLVLINGGAAATALALGALLLR
jgi:hypothetical protein